MKVLVLGGTGFLGTRLCQMLHASGWATPLAACATAAGPGQVQLDPGDSVALARTLVDVDAVVNCADEGGADVGMLVHAAISADFPRLLHLGSMAVYGGQEGHLPESAATDPTRAPGRAAWQAERHLARFAAAGGTATVMWLGCVWGPGNQPWVGRIARWLQDGWLGDLGEAGDGWSNLVHVDDVCRAVMAALRRPATTGAVHAYNLAAPDSPRWNDYFTDLALALGATPLRRISAWRIGLDAYLLGAPLQALKKAWRRFGRGVAPWQEPPTPRFVRSLQQQLKLDARAAERELRVRWTPYELGLRQAVSWLRSDEGATRIVVRAVSPVRAREATSEGQTVA